LFWEQKLRILILPKHTHTKRKGVILFLAALEEKKKQKNNLRDADKLWQKALPQSSVFKDTKESIFLSIVASCIYENFGVGSKTLLE